MNTITFSKDEYKDFVRDLHALRFSKEADEITQYLADMTIAQHPKLLIRGSYFNYQYDESSW